jgi:hypothetical protein
MNRGIVSYCDNCLVETPGHHLSHLDLGGHSDTRSVSGLLTEIVTT